MSTETPNETDKPVLEQAVNAIDTALEASAPPPAPEPELVDPEVPAEPEAVPEAVEPPSEAEPVQEPKPDEAVKAEMDSLGIKSPKSRERFEAMSHEIATFRPIKEALEQAGITDPAQLPMILSRAQAADTFEQALEQTNAPPEDFALALDVLAKLNSGDTAQAGQAFDTLQEILKYWAPRLGRDGVNIDPLDDFPDLKEQVGFGELKREVALEIARARAEAKTQQGRAQYEQQTKQAEDERQSAAQALNNWDVQMQSHPQLATKFKALKPQLEAHLRAVTGRLPPSEWLPSVQDLFNSLPAPAPVMAPARPMRPVATVPPPVAPLSDDPFAALELALSQQQR